MITEDNESDKILISKNSEMFSLNNLPFHLRVIKFGIAATGNE